MAVSIEVWDGTGWKAITSESAEKPEPCKVVEGTGLPTDIEGRIYINLDQSVTKGSEKIYFNI